MRRCAYDGLVKYRGLGLAVAVIGCIWTMAANAARQAPVGEAAAAPPALAEDQEPDWNPAAIDSEAQKLPRLLSLLVSRNGELIFERYYNHGGRDRPANIKSTSKSVISALVGIAIDRGLIPDGRTPIVTYFPELANDADSRKRRITVEDLLTMRSGLEGTSNRNYGAWVTSRNWVRHALARPMFAAPGEEMEYSTGNTHLLSAILTKAARKSTWQFANEVLARPLGFTFAQWPRDPQGIYFGGNDMLMTSRQMLAFGELYLNRGRAGGRQIVPECVGGTVVRGARANPASRQPGVRRAARVRADARSEVRLRLVGLRDPRLRQLFRVGVRRTVSLRGARDRSGHRDDLVTRRERGASRSSSDPLRHPRSADRRARRYGLLRARSTNTYVERSAAARRAARSAR